MTDRLCRAAALGLAAVAFAATADAAPITNPAFFSQPGDVFIDFDGLATGTDLTTQIPGLVFGSEPANSVGTLQTTDPADASGRFAAPITVRTALSGGGTPSSAPHYVNGEAFGGLETSDMRIDFTGGASAFGMQVIDNDFTDVRLQAFDAGGALLETLVIPEVNEGGVGYHGIDRTGGGPAISYFILDADGGADLDSTFLDDLSYRPVAPIPAPAAMLLALTGLGALGGLRCRGAGGSARRVGRLHRRDTDAIPT